jgi:hypothetical protein
MKPWLHYALWKKKPARACDFIAAARTMIEGDAPQSVAAVRRIVTSAFGDPEALFYLTRHLARLNEVDFALDVFERVVDGGFFCYPAMARDPWLDPLRKNPRFLDLLSRAEAQHREAEKDFASVGGSLILGLASRQ